MLVKNAFLESDISKELLDGPFEGDVEFEYTICPGRTRTDLDNYAKSMLDSAIRAGIFKDDSQVTTILATKCQKCRNLKGGNAGIPFTVPCVFCLLGLFCILRFPRR